MIGMLGVLAIWLHRNWPGAVSTREHQAKLVGVQPTLLAGVLAAINDYTGEHPFRPMKTVRRPARCRGLRCRRRSRGPGMSGWLVPSH